MEHDFSVAGYLARCKQHRKTGTLQALLYAALELRLGIETRLAEVIAESDGLSKAERRQWAIPDLSRTIEKNFKSGDAMLALIYRFEDPEEVLELKYFPVNTELQKIAMRLGDYLHRNERLETNLEQEVAALGALVKQGYGLLAMADSSELLGMPQLDAATGPPKLVLKMAQDDPRRGMFRQGRRYRLQVFHALPVGNGLFVEAEDMSPPEVPSAPNS